MKHRRIDIFGHQTSLPLERAYWDWIGELRAKTGASLRDVIEAVAANKPPDRSLSSAIRVAITKYFHGGDPTIYHCPGHIVPARDGSVHLTVRGKGRKKKTDRKAAPTTA